MNNSVIKNKLIEKIDSLRDIENSIIVLKGIPMEAVGSETDFNMKLEKIVENKLEYFLNIYGKRKYITYEEFILLNSFILDQYKNVYIFVNNIYMNQYPLDMPVNASTKDGILKHFMDTDGDENDEEVIGDIDEYIGLYNGVREYNGILLGVYCDEKIPSSTKIEYINLFENEKMKFENVETSTPIIDLVEEADYVYLVKKVFQKPDELHIRISNYMGDINKLKLHLKILISNWSNWTRFYIVQTQKSDNEFQHREEYTGILKKYWGYSSFRNIPVYDIAKVEDDKKEIIQISQENIISNLVQQVENCANDNANIRDLFVTAPTGAGKSVMFQIPAIYLAEKYNLLTIVISPLIGLMNDQVKNLELKNYKGAKTINSDISPIIKSEIMEKVSNSEYHILYISPETLLSRSDVEQLIGDRTIGMIVIDEAHIVTTWGKQFRPDYWYLGDHIKKLRKSQLKKKQRSFVIATFTATAIYHGIEDMYTETINSLHMLNPITYLGYVRRNDIKIVIDKSKKDKNVRNEYELDKFEELERLIKRAMIMNKKTLVYFPTVALINRCYEYLRAKREIEQIAYTI